MSLPDLSAKPKDALLCGIQQNFPAVGLLEQRFYVPWSDTALLGRTKEILVDNDHTDVMFHQRIQNVSSNLSGIFGGVCPDGLTRLEIALEFSKFVVSIRDSE